MHDDVLDSSPRNQARVGSAAPQRRRLSALVPLGGTRSLATRLPVASTRSATDRSIRRNTNGFIPIRRALALRAAAGSSCRKTSRCRAVRRTLGSATIPPTRVRNEHESNWSAPRSTSTRATSSSRSTDTTERRASSFRAVLRPTVHAQARRSRGSFPARTASTKPSAACSAAAWTTSPRFVTDRAPAAPQTRATSMSSCRIRSPTLSGGSCTRCMVAASTELSNDESVAARLLRTAVPNSVRFPSTPRNPLFCASKRCPPPPLGVSDSSLTKSSNRDSPSSRSQRMRLSPLPSDPAPLTRHHYGPPSAPMSSPTLPPRKRLVRTIKVLAVASLAAVAAIASFCLFRFQHPEPTSAPGPDSSATLDTTAAHPETQPSRRRVAAPAERLAEGKQAPEGAVYELRVRCANLASGDLASLARVEVQIKSASMQATSERKRPSRDGLVTFDAVRPGEYYVAGRDPDGLLSVVRSSIGPRGVASVPCQEVTLEFAPRYVADVRCIGDDVVVVGSGRTPDGFQVEARSPYRGPGRWRFDYRPLAVGTFPGLPGSVVVTVYGKNHGECRFDVPLVRADLVGDPFVCDLSSFPVRPARLAKFTAVDSAGEAVSLDVVELRCANGPTIDCMLGEPCWAPFGHDYALFFGRFPVRWQSLTEARLDGRVPNDGASEICIHLPVEYVTRPVLVTVDDKPVPQGDAFQVHVLGEWGNRRLVLGVGGTKTFTSGDLGSMSLPVGSMVWSISIRGHRYTQKLEVSRDLTPLVVRLGS